LELVQKLIAAVLAGLLLLALPGSLSLSAQTVLPSEAARQAELRAAWQAAGKAGTAGPSNFALIDQAKLSLAADRFFVPKAEGLRVLRALGNVPDETTFIGLVLSTRQNEPWMVVIRYIKEGYIKDDDAKDWNADELLKNISEGVEQTNRDRIARGFPELQVVGWIEPPAYDADAHRLVWSLLGKDKDQPDDTPRNVNYNTYALGRDGYFSLNLLSDSQRIATDKAAARELLAALQYNAGKRYEDFSAATDRVAQYGLMALIGGAVAKKLGLFALLGAMALKFAKVIFVGVLAFGAGIVKFFRRKPQSDAP
jgi:uncharacterized membrane-anchored protein